MWIVTSYDIDGPDVRNSLDGVLYSTEQDARVGADELWAANEVSHRAYWNEVRDVSEEDEVKWDSLKDVKVGEMTFHDFEWMRKNSWQFENEDIPESPKYQVVEINASA